MKTGDSFFVERLNEKRLTIANGYKRCSNEEYDKKMRSIIRLTSNASSGATSPSQIARKWPLSAGFQTDRRSRVIKKELVFSLEI